MTITLTEALEITAEALSEIDGITVRSSGPITAPKVGDGWVTVGPISPADYARCDVTLTAVITLGADPRSTETLLDTFLTDAIDAITASALPVADLTCTPVQFGDGMQGMQLSFTTEVSPMTVSGTVPIGGVIPWLKSLAGTPALDAEYTECNGQTLSDADSVYDGEVIPDLNGSSGSQRFLRGATVSGGTGGSDTHVHTLDTATRGFYTGYNYYAALAPLTVKTASASTLPKYYETVMVMRIK